MDDTFGGGVDTNHWEAGFVSTPAARTSRPGSSRRRDRRRPALTTVDAGPDHPHEFENSFNGPS